MNSGQDENWEEEAVVGAEDSGDRREEDNTQIDTVHSQEPLNSGEDEIREEEAVVGAEDSADSQEEDGDEEYGNEDTGPTWPDSMSYDAIVAIENPEDDEDREWLRYGSISGIDHPVTEGSSALKESIGAVFFTYSQPLHDSHFELRFTVRYRDGSVPD